MTAKSLRIIFYDHAGEIARGNCLFYPIFACTGCRHSFSRLSAWKLVFAPGCLSLLSVKFLPLSAGIYRKSSVPR